MKYDMICAGMALIDSIIKGFDKNPVSASGYRAQSGTLNIGGEAVNEAITAARLGMNCSIICSLANDSAGDMIKACLEANNVDTSLILYRNEPPTPVTTMFVNDDGTRKSVTTKAHTFNFRPDEHIYLAICSFVTIVLYMTGHINTMILAGISEAVTCLYLVSMILLGGRKAEREIKRRFHI